MSGLVIGPPWWLVWLEVLIFGAAVLAIVSVQCRFLLALSQTKLGAKLGSIWWIACAAVLLLAALHRVLEDRWHAWVDAHWHWP